MRFRNVNWSIVNGILGIAFAIVAISLTTWSISITSTSLGNTTAILNSLAPRVEMTWAVSNLSSPSWGSYIETTQRVALGHNPALVMHAVGGGMAITDDGREFLTKSELWEAVSEQVEMNGDGPLNEVILGLGVERLQNEAVEYDVPLNAVIGTTSTLAMQIREY